MDGTRVVFDSDVAMDVMSSFNYVIVYYLANWQILIRTLILEYICWILSLNQPLMWLGHRPTAVLVM